MVQLPENHIKMHWPRRSWRVCVLTVRWVLHSAVFLLLIYILVAWFYFTNFNSGPRDGMVISPLEESQNTLPKAKAIDEGKVVRILCVDGGGVKGLLALQVIKELEESTGKPACELFDLMVGTSTGGIIVSTLAVPNTEGKPKWSANDVIQMYDETIVTAFTNSLTHQILTCNGILGAKIESSYLDRLLRAQYGQVQMSQLLTGVSIPCFSITRNLPALFNSRDLPGGRGHNFRLADVLGGITAAPVFYRPMRISDVTNNNEELIADAGIYANNPVLFALNIATQMFPGRHIVIVSLGTGIKPGFDGNLDDLRWGMLNWAKAIVPIATQGQSTSADWTLRIQSGAPLSPVMGYYRINEKLEREMSPLFYTGPGQVEELNRLGQSFVEKNIDKIDEIVDVLMNPTLDNVISKRDIGVTPWTETFISEERPAKASD
jgi:patatin-like phospholipase/acyl hydrolase